MIIGLLFLFIKQKSAYEMRISDLRSDVCSADLLTIARSSPYLQSQIRKRDGGSLTLLVHSLNLFPKKGLILYDLSNLNRSYPRQSNRRYPKRNLFAHL